MSSISTKNVQMHAERQLMYDANESLSLRKVMAEDLWEESGESQDKRMQVSFGGEDCLRQTFVGMTDCWPPIQRTTVEE